MLEHLIDEPDFKWLMIDASHCKVHPHAAGAQGGSQGIGRTKGGSTPRLHLAVDAQGMPIRLAITSATQADCAKASGLIEGLQAQHLIAGKGYG